MAGRAPKPGRMLPSKEFCNEGQLSMSISAPFHLAHDKFWRLLALKLLLGREGAKRRARPIGIEVFMQTINDEIEELFGILLSIDSPFTVEPSAERTESARSYCFYVAFPDAAYEIVVKLWQHPFTTLPVVSLNLVPVLVVQEE